MSSAGFDRRLGVVVCDHCGAIFDLTRRSDRASFTDTLDAPTETPALAPDRAPVALPEHFEVHHRGDGSLSVQWRWYQSQFIFIIIFAIGWDSFLALWYGAVLGHEEIPWMMVVLPLAHLAAGVGVTYWGLTGLLNRTCVTCTRHMLKVRHGPLPWFPQPTIPLQDLEQLYVERTVHHSEKSTTVHWNVMAVTREHSGVLLLEGLDTLQQALWLEQAIEDRLDIRDRPVAGEYLGEGTDQV